MAWDQWTADCGACAALCCRALAFDAGTDFAHDKPAGEDCRHLSGHACTIHDRLEAAGYPGCRRYDCLGAGQRATATGADFAATRRLHEDHLMLQAAASLPLPEATHQHRLSLMAKVGAAQDLGAAEIEAHATGPLPTEIRAFLRGLRGSLPRP